MIKYFKFSGRPVGPKCSTCLCQEICPTGKSQSTTNRKHKVKISTSEEAE